MGILTLTRINRTFASCVCQLNLLSVQQRKLPNEGRKINVVQKRSLFRWLQFSWKLSIKHFETFYALLTSDVRIIILQDVYFDDESAEVVISSLRLGDDQERYVKFVACFVETSYTPFLIFYEGTWLYLVRFVST